MSLLCGQTWRPEFPLWNPEVEEENWLSEAVLSPHNCAHTGLSYPVIFKKHMSHNLA